MRHKRENNEDGRKRFGSKIREARNDAGLSQAKLAKSAGISPVYLSQIEGGARIPSFGVLKGLVVAMPQSGLDWRELVLETMRLVADDPEVAALFVQTNRGHAQLAKLSRCSSFSKLVGRLENGPLPIGQTEALLAVLLKYVDFVEEGFRRELPVSLILRTE